jgi:hypothetical protein
MFGFPPDHAASIDALMKCALKARTAQVDRGSIIATGTAFLNQ